MRRCGHEATAPQHSPGHMADTPNPTRPRPRPRPLLSVRSALAAAAAAASFLLLRSFPPAAAALASPHPQNPAKGTKPGRRMAPTPAMPPLADRRSVPAAAEAAAGLAPIDFPYFSLGLDTYRVPAELHRENRQRLVGRMLASSSSAGGEGRGLVLLEGGKQTTRYDTDHEPVFRQESYFHWAFGMADAPDAYGAISLPGGRTTVFVPRRSLDYTIVCGAVPDLDQVRDQYGVDEARYVDELPAFVDEELREVDGSEEEEGPPMLHLLRGLNTDSGNMAIPARYDGISAHADRRDFDLLFPSIAECRVRKTALEVGLMRYTHWVSCMAHVEVMRTCRPGMMEYQLESLFQHHTYTHGGCRHMSYTCICACGPNPAVLHYGHGGRPNNRLLEPGDMALLDMGAEYHCYASDITCSYPVDGTFTPDQRAVYEAVLEAQVEVIRRMRPAASWTEMHRAAERCILRGLQGAGILAADADIEDMIAADLGAIFMPHGLGHLIGLDTHDVGGYAEGTPPRSERPGLSKLRTARILEAGMVLTVEPGCYFIDPLLDLALADPRQAKFFVPGRLDDFRGMGGVRLEDGVLVTEDGCENLTVAPRAVEEVLDVMGGRQWPPERDVMPELKRNWISREAGRMVPIDVPPAKA